MPFYVLYQNVVITNGRSDLYMWCNIGQMVIQLALVLLLFSKGITAIVLSNSALTILWIMVWQLQVKRLICLRLIDVLKDVVPFLLVSLLVMAVTYVATISITSLAFLLTARILMAALLYAGIMKILQAKVMDECIAFIRKKG